MSLNRAANVGVLVVEFSHIICCALPMMMVFLGTGAQITIGGTLLFSHEAIHHYEIPLFIGSALLLLIGFLLQNLHWFRFARPESCDGDSCRDNTLKMSIALKVALFIFVGNLVFYLFSNHALT